MKPVVVISATRLTEEDFWKTSALGLSLNRIKCRSALRPLIAVQNKRGLSNIYNKAIDISDEDSILVFVHDDVWLDDYFFAERCQDALRNYDVIGVAGGNLVVPDQSSWYVADDNPSLNGSQPRSGSVAHGEFPFSAIANYGPTPMTCDLLDGVLLAADRQTLVTNGVRFDEQFDFHFYDLDFCRSASNKNLKLGTWPIALTHQGKGNSDSPGWRIACQKYFNKWGTGTGKFLQHK